MKQRQLTKTINDALQYAMSNLHTATIARVTAVNDTTIDCQPVINRVVDGRSVQLPVFAQVPTVTLQGGGSYTKYPIAVDDYCLLIFTERCFDRWWSGVDNAPPLEFRMHDYSDGIAIVGLNPMASAVANVDVITQIGDTYQHGDYEHDGNRTQTGDYEQTGSLTRTGNETVDGDRTHNGNETVTGDRTQTGNITITGLLTAVGVTSSAPIAGPVAATTLSVGGADGVSGTFLTADSKTVTVTGGIITAITGGA